MRAAEITKIPLGIDIVSSSRRRINVLKKAAKLLKEIDDG